MITKGAARWRQFESLTTTSTVTTNVTDDADATTVTLTASAANQPKAAATASVFSINPVTGSPLVITLTGGTTITIPCGSSSASSAPVSTRADDAHPGGGRDHEGDTGRVQRQL